MRPEVASSNPAPGTKCSCLWVCLSRSSIEGEIEVDLCFLSGSDKAVIKGRLKSEVRPRQKLECPNPIVDDTMQVCYTETRPDTSNISEVSLIYIENTKNRLKL